MKKRYQDMTAAELAEATREYDRPGTIDRTRPMTAAERAKDRKARRGGRPRVGRGSERVNITLERGLLAEADAFGRQHKLARSRMVAEGLRLFMRRRAS